MTYSELIEGAYLEIAKKAIREIEAHKNKIAPAIGARRENKLNTR
ncbi:TPA: hypothetical protein ACS772_002058 [Providencia alcalifaciens]